MSSLRHGGFHRSELYHTAIRRGALFFDLCDSLCMCLPAWSCAICVWTMERSAVAVVAPAAATLASTPVERREAETPRHVSVSVTNAPLTAVR